MSDLTILICIIGDIFIEKLFTWNDLRESGSGCVVICNYTGNSRITGNREEGQHQ